MPSHNNQGKSQEGTETGRAGRREGGVFSRSSADTPMPTTKREATAARGGMVDNDGCSWMRERESL